MSTEEKAKLSMVNQGSLSDNQQNEEPQIESEDVYEKLTYIVDKGQEPMRIDKWVQMRIVGLTRSKLQNGIEGGFLTVNGKVVKSNYRTRPGDEVVYMSYVNPDYTELKPEEMALDIVYGIIFIYNIQGHFL